MEFSKEEFENASTIFLADELVHLERCEYLIGTILKGLLSVGDKLICFSKNKEIVCKVKGIEKHKQHRLKKANKGDVVGLKIKCKNSDEIKKDDYFIIPGKTKRN